MLKSSLSSAQGYLCWIVVKLVQPLPFFFSLFLGILLLAFYILDLFSESICHQYLHLKIFTSEFFCISSISSSRILSKILTRVMLSSAYLPSCLVENHVLLVRFLYSKSHFCVWISKSSYYFFYSSWHFSPPAAIFCQPSDLLVVLFLQVWVPL